MLPKKGSFFIKVSISALGVVGTAYLTTKLLISSCESDNIARCKQSALCEESKASSSSPQAGTRDRGCGGLDKAWKERYVDHRHILFDENRDNVYPDDLSLVSLHMVHRHGARTVVKNRFSHILEVGFLSCALVFL